MLTNGISHINHNSLVVNTSKNTKHTEQNLSTILPMQNSSSVVEISPQAQLANISSQYDVTNMSSKEMNSMAKELMKNGQINEEQYLKLTLEIRPPEGIFNENTPINYLKQYQDQTILSMKSSTEYDVQMLGKITSILQSLKDIRNT
jgi:antitoxin component YwqK of YwqJK toxin-antitoxin module